MKPNPLNSLRATLLIAISGFVTALPAAELPLARNDANRLPLGQTVILSTGQQPYLWFHKEGLVTTTGKSLDDAYVERCKRYDPALEWAGGFTRHYGPCGIPVTLPPSGVIAAAATLDWLVDNVIAVKEGLQKGVSRPQVEHAQTAFSNSFKGFALQQGIHERLFAIASEHRPEQFARSADQHDPMAVRYVNYTALGNQDVKTAVVLEVLSAGLEPASGHSSKLALHATAYARVIRVSDRKQLASCTAEYRTERPKARKLQDWSAKEGEALRTEIERCQRELGNKLARQLGFDRPVEMQLQLADKSQP